MSCAERRRRGPATWNVKGLPQTDPFVKEIVGKILGTLPDPINSARLFHKDM